MLEVAYTTTIAFTTPRVATGSNDNTARVFEATTGKEISRFKQYGQVLVVAFSPDGRGVTTGTRVFETTTGEQVSRLHKP